jgi:hypothetical protein
MARRSELRSVWVGLPDRLDDPRHYQLPEHASRWLWSEHAIGGSASNRQAIREEMTDSARRARRIKAPGPAHSAAPPETRKLDKNRN